MVFTQTSLGHVVVQDCLYFPKYGYCDVLQDYICDYVDDIVGSKRHAKWMSYSHVNMAAVDVHKRKLVLKEGHFCSVIGYKNNAATRVVEVAVQYNNFSRCLNLRTSCFLSGGVDVVVFSY